MNKVIEIGRTTKEMDLSYTPQTQTAVGRFTLAVPRERDREKSDFILCKVWGKQAEIMSKYVKKGHKVGIFGRIETGSYKDRDGVTHYTTEVVVEDFEFLEPKHEEGNQSNTQQERLDDLPEGYEQSDDDVPF